MGALCGPVGTHRAPIGALCEGSSMRLYTAGPYPTVCQSSRTPRLFIRSNLISSGWIWLEFKLIQYFMPVLVTCKFADDPIKNTGAIVSKAFLPVLKGR